MKTLIAIYAIAVITGISSVGYVNTTINKLVAVNKAQGQQVDEQYLQGGEDNTVYTLQPAIRVTQAESTSLQSEPESPELQPAAGYQALNWKLQ